MMRKKNQMGRGARLALCLFAAVCLLCLRVRADDMGTDEAVTTPDVYRALDGLLPELFPDGADDLLPDGLFSSDPEEVRAAAGSLSGLPAMVRLFTDALGLRLPEAVRLLASLIGLLLLSALLGRLREGLGGGAGDTLSFCLRLGTFAAILSLTVGLADTVRDVLDRLSLLCGGLVPVTGTLYALGGGVSRAAVDQTLLTAFLSVLEFISAKAAPPVCGVCLGLTLTEALGTRLRLAPVAGAVRKGYVSLVGLVSFLLSAALGLQSVLASGADSLRMKGVRYAVGAAIPIVGGTVSGSLGAAAAALSSLRGLCGVSALILLGLLLLPPLVELLLYRAMISLAASAASMLGCDPEARLLGEIAALYAAMAAAVALCSLFLVLVLGLLIKGAA